MSYLLWKKGAFLCSLNLGHAPSLFWAQIWMYTEWLGALLAIIQVIILDETTLNAAQLGYSRSNRSASTPPGWSRIRAFFVCRVKLLHVPCHVCVPLLHVMLHLWWHAVCLGTFSSATACTWRLAVSIFDSFFCLVNKLYWNFREQKITINPISFIIIWAPFTRSFWPSKSWSGVGIRTISEEL